MYNCANRVDGQSGEWYNRAMDPSVSPRVREFQIKLKALLPELQARYGVRSLGVFGSFVRGEEKPTSDLDILVEFDDRPMGLYKFIELENYLTDSLGVHVDLVEKKGLKPAIGQRILAEVITL